MATVSAAGSVVIKVPLPQKKDTKKPLPAIAKRLQEREPTARTKTSPVCEAHKELLVNEQKKKKADAARAHNAHVQAVRNAHVTDEEARGRLKESLDERFEKSEMIRWYAIDDKIEKAVHNGTFAVARAAERLECRKAKLAEHIDRSLESAEEKRRDALRRVQFKASNVVQKHKAVVTQQAYSKQSAAARIVDQLEAAARKRAAILAGRAQRAAELSAGRIHSARRAAESRDTNSKTLAASLQARMAAAECLHHLNLRLRQSKAALTNEHHSLVVARKRRADALAPLVNSARISAELLIAGQRRNYVLAVKEASAHAVVERSEKARVAREEQAKFNAEIMRARIECKLAAAAARKEKANLEKRLHGKSSSPKSSPIVSPRAYSSSSTPSPTAGSQAMPRSRLASAASRVDEKPVMVGHAVPAWGLSSIVPAPRRTATHLQLSETEAAVQTPAEWDVQANAIAADGAAAAVEVEVEAEAQWARPRVSVGALSDDSARATHKVGKTARTADKSVTAKPVAASALKKPAPATTVTDAKKRSGAKAERLGFISWMQGVMMAEADAKDAADALIGTHPLPDADDDWEVVSSEAEGDLVLV